MRAARGFVLVAITTVSLSAAVTADAASCGGLLASLLPSRCQPPAAAPDPGGSESPAQPVPPPGKSFGFNAALFIAGQATAAQELDAARAAGANLYRLPVTWRVMQPDRGDPPLPEAAPGNLVERLDAFYAAALEREITPIFIPHWAPVWATSYDRCPLLDFGCRWVANSDHKLVPDRAHLDEYEAFVRAVKSRWPRALIEPWNTPNLYWNDPGFRGSRDFSATPEHFAAIQCAAHRASRSVNADPVLAAGWAVHRYAEYLERVYAAGGDDCWDIANLHVYPGDQVRFDAGSILARVFWDARRLREAHGDHDPIWVTETGYTTTGRHRVSTETQADASQRLYNRLATMPDVQAVMLHTLRDSPLPFPPYDDHSHGEYGFGLLREDWTPKPAYCGFAGQAGNEPSAC